MGRGGEDVVPEDGLVHGQQSLTGTGTAHVGLCQGEYDV